MTIYDGRESFYQWDLNQKVTSDDFNIGDKIHFYSLRHPTALSTKAYELDGKVVADVPNILLQTTNPIRVYRYISTPTSAQTVDEQTFVVKQKQQPSDYFYTETELYELRSDVERAAEEADAGEKARQNAEIDRVDAESKRSDNETARTTAENKRVEAESKRVTAENLRVEAESKRVTAENKRVTAEQSRVDAEALRIEAEQGRVEAENLRNANFESLPNNLGNALKGSASGEVVRVDDVSPIEHLVNAKVSGKNLFPTNLSTGHFTLDGSLNEDSDYRSVIIFLSKGVYTMSADTNVVLMRKRTRGRVESLTHLFINGAYSFELSEDSEVGFSFRLEPKIAWNDTVRIQLEQGNTATEYEPYVDPTTVTVTRCGKAVFSQAEINVAKGESAWASVLTAQVAVPEGSYVASCKFKQNGMDKSQVRISVRRYDDYSITIGNAFSTETSGTLETPFTVEKGSGGFQIYLYSNYTSEELTTECLFENLIVEVGDTSTGYEPYNGSTYTPKADGTVDIASLSPTMTLLTDTAGVTIEAEYNRDINVVINDILKLINNETEG